MKYLVIYSHPNPKSFNHAILDTVVSHLKNNKHEVYIRDLYQMHFDPVLSANDFDKISRGQVPEDAKKEHDFIKWAECVVVISPIWWTGLPAEIKGYFDRVLLKGFAYDTNASGIVPLLKGKKAVIINTTGTPENIYNASGMFKSLRQVTDEGIFQFTGMEVTAHKFFAGVPLSSEEERKAMLEEVKKLF